MWTKEYEKVTSIFWSVVVCGDMRVTGVCPLVRQPVKAMTESKRGAFSLSSEVREDRRDNETVFETIKGSALCLGENILPSASLLTVLCYFKMDATLYFSTQLFNTDKQSEESL